MMNMAGSFRLRPATKQKISAFKREAKEHSSDGPQIFPAASSMRQATAMLLERKECPPS